MSALALDWPARTLSLLRASFRMPCEALPCCAFCGFVPNPPESYLVERPRVATAAEQRACGWRCDVVVLALCGSRFCETLCAARAVPRFVPRVFVEECDVRWDHDGEHWRRTPDLVEAAPHPLIAELRRGAEALRELRDTARALDITFKVES